MKESSAKKLTRLQPISVDSLFIMGHVTMPTFK